ncbi:MAG: rod shape-determining protein MreC [Oscillospiraceae bacterium]|nr:rod shape-determining protein MreC [Oscillospiraceae bacterium]
MRDFFGSVRFKIIIGIMALLLGFMIYAGVNGGITSTTSYLLEVVFEPVKRLSTGISDNVSNSLDMLLNAEKYYEENKELKERMGELYSRMVDYDSVKRENEELRMMLELKEKYDAFDFSPPCTIISRTTNDPYSSFTIDKGERDGIKSGDPVVTKNGLVGVCAEVSYSTSKVRTLFSPETSVGAYTVRTQKTGLVSGGYELASEKSIRLEYLDNDTDVENGDIVVTSGSESFPPSLIIGTVDRIEAKNTGLSKYAVVKPLEDPSELTGVFVIINYEPDEAILIRNGSDSVTDE